MADNLDAPTPATDSTSATLSIERTNSLTAAIEKYGFLSSVEELPYRDSPEKDIPSPATPAHDDTSLGDLPDRESPEEDILSPATPAHDSASVGHLPDHNSPEKDTPSPATFGDDSNGSYYNIPEIDIPLPATPAHDFAIPGHSPYLNSREREFLNKAKSSAAINYGTINKKTKHDPAAKTYLDLSETHIATMLSKFKQLVTLCIAPEEEAATLETQASRSLQIEREWQALVKAAEDLLKLTRELKELWLAGPLRGIGEGDDDGDMAENAKRVQELIDGMTKKAREMGVETNGKSD